MLCFIKNSGRIDLKIAARRKNYFSVIKKARNLNWK